MVLTRKQADALVELSGRRCEALNLFRPLPSQIPFFRCDAREVLGRGGNRSGKSTVAAIRFAALATDRPLYTTEGDRIEMRRPSQKNRSLTMWVIGLGQDHIGQTLYRLLFRPGVFKIIRDLETKQWRAYRPWDASDESRSSEVKPAPPLIPARYCNPKSWTWENKAARVFQQVEIWNPETKEQLAMIYAFTSSGDVKAGDPVDEIWIDERIKYPSYYAEWQARLLDRQGRLVWSSWPDITNNALVNLTRRAEKEAESSNPVVREFVFRMSDNPHLATVSKAEALRGWTEEERLARDQGEYVTETLRMYPSFSRELHSAILENPTADDKISHILRERNGEPPGDWTRELVLDPGTSHPAILLCAVPPPTLGDFMIPYREIYVPRLDADALAKVVLSITRGMYFERFIIDPMAGRQTPMGYNLSVHRNYSRAFDEQGLRCRQTGSAFSPGSNDVAGRILNLQSWMVIRPSGFPRLRIVVDKCPNLCNQLERYVKQLTGGSVTEFKPAKNQTIDLAVCLEYWSSRNPEWHSQPTGSAQLSSAHMLYMSLQKKHGPKGKPSDSVLLGPVQEVA